MTEAIFTQIVSTGVLLAIPLIIILLLTRYTRSVPYGEWIRGQIQDNGIALAFLVTLFATLGALTYSNVFMFAVCEFCWYQRIAIYPMIVLLGMAAIRKDTFIKPYVIVLATIGMAVSIYHWFVHMVAFYGSQSSADALVPCDSNSIISACSKSEILEYGFITIPFMAIVTLGLVITLMLFIKNRRA